MTMRNLILACLLVLLGACSASPHAPAPVAVAPQVAAPADTACKKVPMWLAYVGQKAAQNNATPRVIAEKEGDEAKHLVAAFNAAPPSTNIAADQFIVVAFLDTASEQPLSFVYAGFFVNGCLTSSGRLHTGDAMHLISGEWPAPGDPA